MAGVTICLILMAGLVVADDHLAAVDAPAGEIHGTVESTRFDNKDYTYTIFKGIPFAESTAGDGRFKMPAMKKTFSTPFSATKIGPACPQNLKIYPELQNMSISEDCLHLSIVVPGNVATAKDLPVMIFIYGGGFQMGWYDSYVSPAFATVNNVILVLFNYRVGPFGFLSDADTLKGNYGLWDQHMAIKWVHINIGKFGGDTGRVTLFGQSAGAASVIYQAMYTENKGMFQNVIAQSGTALSAWAYNPNPKYMYDQLARNFKCDEQIYNDKIIDCLRNKTVEDSVDNIGTGSFFLPVIDGEFLKMSPQEIFSSEMSEAKKVMAFFGELNVVLGVNSYDGITDWNDAKFKMENGLSTDEFKTKVYDAIGMFLALNDKVKDVYSTALQHEYGDWSNSNPWNNASLRQAYADVLTDYFYIKGITNVAMEHVKADKDGKLYMYQFDHKPSISRSADWVKGAMHSEDLPFVLAMPREVVSYIGGFNLQFPNGDPATVVPSIEMQLSKDMMGLFAQIASNGHPTDQKEWPEYKHETQQYIVIKANTKPFPVESHLRAQFANFWNEVVPEIKKAGDISSCDWGVTVSTGTNVSASAGIMLYAIALLVLLKSIF